MALSSKDKLYFEQHLDYLWEEKRLATYKKWVFSKDEACNAQKMSEAGFVFVGNKHEKDAVKCFLCDKALDGWDADDDPWSEHLKHSKNCFFAKLQLPEDAMTVEQFLNIKQELAIALFTRIFKEKKEDLNAEFDHVTECLQERCNS